MHTHWAWLHFYAGYEAKKGYRITSGNVNYNREGKYTITSRRTSLYDTTRSGQNGTRYKKQQDG